MSGVHIQSKHYPLNVCIAVVNFVCHEKRCVHSISHECCDKETCSSELHCVKKRVLFAASIMNVVKKENHAAKSGATKTEQCVMKTVSFAASIMNVVTKENHAAWRDLNRAVCHEKSAVYGIHYECGEKKITTSDINLTILNKQKSQRTRFNVTS